MLNELQATNGSQCYLGLTWLETRSVGAFGGALWGLGWGVARRCSACNDWHQGVHWV